MFARLMILDILLAAVAGLVNERQLRIIEFQAEEIRVLRQMLGDRRLRFSNGQRCRLAAKAKALGRSVLEQIGTIVTPDTLLRWHRELIARKWDHSRKRGPGRPRTIDVIRRLIVRLALENPNWGYTKIQGALAHLNHEVSRGTIATILREHGIDPEPERSRKTTWKAFLKAHWSTIVAADFFTVETWTWRGLVTMYVLFFIDLATRRVHIGGITASPDGAWMNQVARNVTDACDGFLTGKRFLIIDRDAKYCREFRDLVSGAGTRVVRLPARSPNLNAHAERFVRTIKDECTRRLILFGEPSVRRSVAEFVVHYNRERFHQSMGNQLLTPIPMADAGPIVCSERLGGLLKYYSRQAA